ncbi:MAG: hypothetical protein FJX75_14350 [Armatimonadetes bacterium]|nr:hypothetical protein [Armatimonadota bacterium]
MNSLGCSSILEALVEQSRFVDLAKEVRDEWGRGEWLTVYNHVPAGGEGTWVFCALLPQSDAEHVLKSTESMWAASPGFGAPACSQAHEGDTSRVTYDRFGNSEGLEPLVLLRRFDGVKPPYVEVSEEFRLFHNLYSDPHTGALVKVTDSGADRPVAEVSTEQVRLRALELRQFLGIRDMVLVLAVEAFQTVHAPLAELARETTNRDADGHLLWEDYAGEDWVLRWDAVPEPEEEGEASCCRLVGKKLIRGLPKEDCDFWPYELPDRFAEFIVGVREDGRPLEHTCDPSSLHPAMGGSGRGAAFLTPVFFRREVLDRYYGDESRYRVVDGYVHCGALWGLPIDNDLPDHVAVFLGDLGRHLPYEEQQYWRGHNVAPEGRLSKTSLKRNILGRFANAESPDLQFRAQYPALSTKWREVLGWPLFLELDADDAYALECLRVPSADSVGAFDQQALFLAKLLADSLNKDGLKAAMPGAPANTPTIGLLDQYLAERGLDDRTPHVAFLRGLQTYRSASVAHRKGANYRKARQAIGLDAATPSDTCRATLTRAVALLQYLDAAIERIAGAG